MLRHSLSDVALFCALCSRQVTSKSLLALYHVLRMRALQLHRDEAMKKRALPVSDSQLTLALKVGVVDVDFHIIILTCDGKQGQ